MNRLQKEIVLRRLEYLENTLDINPNIRVYLEQGKLYYSYLVSGLFGCIDTIDYDPRYKAAVNRFQKATGASVYHVIESGSSLSFLYISSNRYKDDWNFTDPELREDNKVLVEAVVYDLNTGYYEYGTILLEADNGALVRVG